MSRKHKGGPAPVPPGNQPHAGTTKPIPEPALAVHNGPKPSEQDAKRRLGNYATAGEHSIEQPKGKQGPNLRGIIKESEE